MAYPKKGDFKPMSAVDATAYVRSMIDLETVTKGNAARSMESLEAKYGIGFWTLDHFRRGKAKTCDVGLYSRIKHAFIDHCGKQAQRLLHEAAIAQEVDPNEDVAAIQREIEALLARLAAAKISTAKAGRK